MFEIVHSSRYWLNWLLIVGYVFLCIGRELGSHDDVQAFPTSADFFSQTPTNKLDTKLADESFQQMINSKPDSILIGELKPNASALDMMILKNKIANTILKMQELEKQSQTPAPPVQPANELANAECFIEVTRVEKVPGKCHRASNGVPICQSDNYMAISNRFVKQIPRCTYMIEITRESHHYRHQRQTLHNHIIRVGSHRPERHWTYKGSSSN